MKSYEFTILIDERHVTGQYGVSGEEFVPAGSAELVLDPLALKTVGLMNRWLSFWDLIEGSKIRLKENLLHPDTLEVLGTHLWGLILANNVGQELRAKIPGEGQQPLRLSIEFADRADATLKGLPWEFLYEPQGEWYLAAKTELLLTRFVTTTDEPTTVAQATENEKLRALLIAALPNADHFAIHREALRKLRTALNDLQNLNVPEPIEAWDAAAIRSELKKFQYHIVHVVGICRGTPGNPKIYLGGSGDGFEDPGTFINTLTANAMRPRLVILQLCDFVDGDATENFERMAPALIKSRVPAVLALQYAARADQAENIGLGTTFYKSLVDGEHIGAAVQASRKRLLDAHPDRRFGTPVLYLKEDVALRRPLTQTAIAHSTAQSGQSEDAILRGLIGVVQSATGLDRSEQTSILMWVSTLDRHAGFEEVTIAVKAKLRDHLDEPSLDTYAQMLVKLGELQKES
ncbi:MAG TPA: CHAT domain-containing protein [Aldersonia sp.]